MDEYCELYNHTIKQYTDFSSYHINPDWHESPLCHFFGYVLLYCWKGHDWQLISHDDDLFLSLRKTYTDITEELVTEYNQMTNDAIPLYGVILPKIKK